MDRKEEECRLNKEQRHGSVTNIYVEDDFQFDAGNT